MGIVSTRIKFDKTFVTLTHTRKRWCGDVPNDGMWVGTTCVISLCRFRSPLSEQTQEAQDMGGSAPSSKMDAKPLEGRNRKVKTPNGVYSMTFTGKFDGRPHCQVERCWNCSRHSI